MCIFSLNIGKDKNLNTLEEELSQKLLTGFSRRLDPHPMMLHATPSTLRLKAQSSLPSSSVIPTLKTTMKSSLMLPKTQLSQKNSLSSTPQRLHVLRNMELSLHQLLFCSESSTRAPSSYLDPSPQVPQFNGYKTLQSQHSLNSQKTILNQSLVKERLLSFSSETKKKKHLTTPRSSMKLLPNLRERSSSSSQESRMVSNTDLLTLSELMMLAYQQLESLTQVIT